jgi:calcium-dependent protein kinase
MQDHPNIIKVHEFFQDEKHFFIVTELCNGGELFDRIIKSHHFSERKAAETMEQILSAIVYCHDRQIVHRDLKPENVLYESPKPDSPIKVIDFGTSRVFDNDSAKKKMMQKLGTVISDLLAILHRSRGPQETLR